jgi:hypothetical protein
MTVLFFAAVWFFERQKKIMSKIADRTVHHDEASLVKSIIDLAMAKKPSTENRNNDYLSLEEILNCSRDLCSQLNISEQLERRCYKLLLLMSGDSTRTWWEKVQRISEYIRLLDKNSRVDPYRFSKGNPVMRVQRPEENISSSQHYSSTAPSLLEEGAELSLFLNNQTGSFHELKRYERKQEHKEPNPTVSFQASTHYATPAARPLSPPQLSPVPKDNNTFRETLKFNSPEFSIAGKHFLSLY